MDNLEGPYVADAILNLFRTLHLSRGKSAMGLFDTLCDEMGLSLGDGGLVVSKIPSVPQFLNRLLSLKVVSQGTVFEASAHGSRH